MGRRPCCSKEGLNRGSWSVWEDKVLSNYVHLHGEGKWRNLPQQAGLKRCGKSCRLRWLNYLRPNIKRGNISSDEEELIIRLHKLLGNRWSLIAGRLPGRTDNEIKNYWNTNLSKRQRASKVQHPADHRNGTPSPESPHPVIRTKAVRCTKVLIPPPPVPPPLLRDPSPKIAAAAPLIDSEPADFFMDIDIADLLTCDAFLEYDEGTGEDNNGAADHFPVCNDFLVPGIEDRDGGVEFNTLASFLDSEDNDQWISDDNHNSNIPV